jgi:CRP-like cAMP-binding protein
MTRPLSEARSERVLDAVRSLPMFRGLTPKDHRRLAALAVVRDYTRGDSLWRQGDAADDLTILLKGRVKIVHHADAGDVIYEIFGPGEPVGAIAVYNYMPYPASAVCLEPVSLLALPRRDYMELLERYPDFARGVIRELTRMVLSLTHKIEEMRGQRVDVRVAQLFLTLGKRMGMPKGDAVEIEIALTRQEIADLVGTTVESAIRVLSRWGREGVLVTGKGRFVVPSIDRLAHIAEGGEDTESGEPK